MKKFLTCIVAVFLFLALVGCEFFDQAKVKMAFDTNGGSEIETIEAAPRSALTKPADPVKEGLTFGGWYADPDLTEKYEFPEVMPNKSLTIYAKWVVTLTFDSKGGSEVEPIVGDPGSVFNLPENPVYGDYVFIGWFYDEANQNKLTYVMPRTNSTVHAVWQVFENGSAIEVSNEWLINDEGSYLVSQVEEGAKITATPGKGEWSYVYTVLGANLKHNTTIVAYVSGPAGATAVLKIEGGNSEMAAETKVEFTGELQKVVWTVEEKNLSSVAGQKFLIFVNGGTIGCSEDPEYIIVKDIKLYRTIEAGEPQRSVLAFNVNGGSEVEEYYLEPGTPIAAPAAPTKEGFNFLGWFADKDLTVPYEFTVMPESTTTVYAGWALDQKYLVDCDLMGGEFVGLDEGAYTIQNNADSYVLKKNAEGGEWTCMILPMTGKALNGYNLLRVEFAGPEGTQILFKINDSNAGERYVTATGEPQYLELEFDFDLDNSKPLVIFLGPGVAGETGEFEITKLAYGNYKKVINLLVDGWATREEDVELMHFELKDGVLTFSKDPAEGKEWACITLDLEDVDFYNFDTVFVKFRGPVGEQILIKANDTQEQWVNCDGLVQEVEMHLGFEINKEKHIMVLFANPGANGTGNNFEVFELTLSMSKEPVEAPVVAEPRNENLMGGEMTGLDEGHYAIQNNEDSYVLQKTAAASEWTFVVLPMTGKNLEGLNVLRVEFQGKAGEQILFKMNDENAGERWVTMTGELQFMEFDYDGELNPAKPLVLCLTGGVAGESGEFTITRLEYSNYHVITDLLAMDFAPEIAERYELEQANGKITATKTALGGEWDWFGLAPVAAFDGVKFAKLIIEVKGQAGEQILFKANDSFEYWVTCTGETQLLTFDVNKEFDGARKGFIIFCNPGGATSGNAFEITKLQLVAYEEKEEHHESGPKDVDLMNRELKSLGNGEYEITISEGQYVAHKTAIGGEWSAMAIYLNDLDLSDVKLLRVEFQAAAGTPILFKINDENRGERWVTASGEVQFIELEFDFELDNTRPLCIFIGGGVAGESAEMTITKLAYSNNPKIINLLELGFITGSPAVISFNQDKETGKLVFSKTGGGEWDWIGIGPVDPANGAHLIKLVLEVKGAADSRILVKPNDNGAGEKWITMTGEAQLLSFDMDMVIDGGKNLMIIFPEVQTVGTGVEFELTQLTAYIE